MHHVPDLSPLETLEQTPIEQLQDFYWLVTEKVFAVFN
jgi:hypothetical protein